MGEFNSGKTALVNAMAGTQVLAPSSVLHTTHPTVVTYATRPVLAAETNDRRRVRLSALDEAPLEGVRRLHVGVPLPSLRAFSLTDTSGLGIADEEIDPRTLAVCRTADIAIWCTPAMQAWKASEEQSWALLPRRVLTRGILAVTFADLVSPADLDRLMARLNKEAGPVFRRIITAQACVGLVGEALAPGSQSLNGQPG